MTTKWFLSSVRRYANRAFSFELLLIFYLFSGVFKTDPMFDLFVIDFTAVLGLASVCSGVYVLRKNQWELKPPIDTLLVIATFGCFVVYAAISVFWSSSDSYALSKLFELGVLSGWPLVASIMIVAPDSQRRKRLYWSITLVGVWFSVETLVATVVLGQPGRMTPYGNENYIGMGRALGICVLVALYQQMFSREASQKLVWSAAALITLLGLFQTGARGPFIALIFTVPVLFVLIAKNRFSLQKSFFHSTQIVGIFAVSTLFSISVGARIIYRMSTLFGLSELIFSDEPNNSGGSSSDPGSTTGSDSGGSSSDPGSTTGSDSGSENGIGSQSPEQSGAETSEISQIAGESAGQRVELVREALDYWMESPIFGNGFGSFAMRYKGKDIRFYPHNIVVETATELGIVGLILLGTLILIPILNFAIKNGRPRHAVLAFAWLCFAGANAMVSGDLGMNRQVFMALGMLSCYTYRRNVSERGS